VNCAIHWQSGPHVASLGRRSGGLLHSAGDYRPAMPAIGVELSPAEDEPPHEVSAVDLWVLSWLRHEGLVYFVVRPSHSGERLLLRGR
jgi:hypothetical protein